ncbi:MAG: HRDC domain-containing protein [Acidiferrobacterales bacterium]|nr:HRDC domain-containing protein [Acidiferrobacterales bacterium]
MELIEQPIADSQTLQQLCKRLLSESEIAVDTEFTRVRTYRPRLELIQVATARIAFCVDVPQCGDISSVKELLRSPSRVIVMHSASQDLEIFRQLQAIPHRLFDTQIAATMCGHERVSYKGLVQELIGVELSKAMTRSNWSARPLSRKQIQYALDDVCNLIPLKLLLSQELDRLSRRSWLVEECGRLLERYRKDMMDIEVYGSFDRAARLGIADQHRVRDLMLWRERRARKINLPVQWVVSDENIMNLVQARPNNEGQVAKVIGLRKFRQSGWLTEVLGILHSQPDPASEPVWKDWVELTRNEKRLVKQVLQVARQSASQHQIPSSLICTRKEAEAIARGKRKGRVFSGWRRELVADAILDLLPDQENV